MVDVSEDIQITITFSYFTIRSLVLFGLLELLFESCSTPRCSTSSVASASICSSFVTRFYPFIVCIHFLFIISQHFLFLHVASYIRDFATLQLEKQLLRLVDGLLRFMKPP